MIIETSDSISPSEIYNLPGFGFAQIVRTLSQSPCSHSWGRQAGTIFQKLHTRQSEILPDFQLKFPLEPAKMSV